MAFGDTVEYVSYTMSIDCPVLVTLEVDAPQEKLEYDANMLFPVVLPS